VRCIRKLHKSAPFDLVHAIWSGSCGVVAVVAARSLGIPSLIHIAGGELVALRDIGYGGQLTWRSRLREAIVLRSTCAITAASSPIIHSLSALGLAATRIPLGVDLDVWPPRDPVARAPDRPARLLHVASLNAVKDQATLLQALDLLARTGVSFEIDIVGEDVLDGAIYRLAEKLDLAGRVRFRGFLTQRQLRSVMEAADLNIISSRHDAGPVVVLEAAVVGVPSVGTAVGHMVEWAPRAALSVPVGDSSGLADAIAKVLSDDNLRLRLAREALTLATREDIGYTVASFERLYSSLVR
jgi:glycosyltransferase involved in cell wall biosynthesis